MDRKVKNKVNYSSPYINNQASEKIYKISSKVSQSEKNLELNRRKILPNNSMIKTNVYGLRINNFPILTNSNINIKGGKSNLANLANLDRSELILSKLLDEYHSETANMNFLKPRTATKMLNQTYSYNSKVFLPGKLTTGYEKM
jgi:hypothetical protein